MNIAQDWPAFIVPAMILGAVIGLSTNIARQAHCAIFGTNRTIIPSQQFGMLACQALNLDPNTTKSLTVTIRATGVPTITAEIYPTDEQGRLLSSLLRQYELQEKPRDHITANG